MSRSMLWLLVLFAPAGPSLVRAERVLRVVDEMGQPVDRCEVMFHTSNQGYDRWSEARGGVFYNPFQLDRYKKAASIDVVVRAPGHASVLKSFSGQAKDELIAQGGEFRLPHGRKVHLTLVPPEGTPLPSDLLPEVNFADLSWRVEIMWQPENERHEKFVLNTLGVKPVEGKLGEYVLHVTDDQSPFVVGIHHPGFIQCFKAGPFTARDVQNGELKLPIARQSSFEIKLVWDDLDQASLPFTAVHYELMRQINPGGGSYLSVSSGDRSLDNTSFRVDGLTPGHYMLMLRTKSNTESDPNSDQVNAGRFADRKVFDLASGQALNAISHFKPFNPDAFRGNRSARIKIIDTNGQPAVGKSFSVSYYDGHFGSLDVAKGVIPADGVVSLTNITDAACDDIPFGPYTATVDGERIGFFRVAATDDPQEFSFHLVPKAGEAAPDIELIDLQSKQPLHLSDLRGKFVYLEFWETGCGPCQGELEKLNNLLGKNGEKWKTDLVVLPVATDAEQNIIAAHVRRKGWSNLNHYWSQHTGGSYFADAAEAYVIHSVPTALFIDRNGKIIYRGHPAAFDLATELGKHQAP